MAKSKNLLNKTWVFVTAATIIVGSSSAMVYALNNNIPKRAVENTASFTAISSKESFQAQSSKVGITAEYTVIDQSKTGPDNNLQQTIKQKLSFQKDLTKEQLEEKYNTIITNMIPGAKDMSAEQAAAYASEIVKNLYGVDLTGYTAAASFSRNPVPNSDNWGVIFHAPQETKSSKRYSVSVDSVTGKILDAGCFNLDFKETTHKNLQDPEWKNKAIEKISKILPVNVTIQNSKVIYTHPQTGVSVVCELSDGSAFAIRLSGENKEAEAIQYFMNGYNGSWDVQPPTANGVG